MNRIAKFEKVSLEQFREGWTDTFGPADEGRDRGHLRAESAFRRERRREAQGMIFLLRQTSCWSREKQ